MWVFSDEVGVAIRLLGLMFVEAGTYPHFFQGDFQMVGWTLVFALLSLAGAVTGIQGMTASLVFGILLIATLVSRALRGPA